MVWERGLVISSKTLLNWEPNQLLPPKRPGSSSMSYCKERLKCYKEVKLSLTTVAREWREMSPQQKARYQKVFLRKQEEYQQQMKEFSQNFANERDKQLYHCSIKKQRKMSAMKPRRKIEFVIFRAQNKVLTYFKGM